MPEILFIISYRFMSFLIQSGRLRTFSQNTVMTFMALPKNIIAIVNPASLLIFIRPILNINDG